MGTSGKILETDQIAELDAIVDRELSKVEDCLWRLEQERDTLQGLARHYKNDVAKEVESVAEEMDEDRYGVLAQMQREMEGTVN